MFLPVFFYKGFHNLICFRNMRGTTQYFVRNRKHFINNPYPTAFPYGNVMVLQFYQQQESSTTKTVHKVINKRFKTYV